MNNFLHRLEALNLIYLLSDTYLRFLFLSPVILLHTSLSSNLDFSTHSQLLSLLFIFKLSLISFAFWICHVNQMWSATNITKIRQKKIEKQKFRLQISSTSACNCTFGILLLLLLLPHHLLHSSASSKKDSPVMLLVPSVALSHQTKATLPSTDRQS